MWYDWMESVYGSPTDEIPPEAPDPKGSKVGTSTYKDANFMHDLVTGRSTSRILHVLKQTPTDWFSKLQNQVKSATYGSEFMAACQSIEQIIYLLYIAHAWGSP